MATIRLTKPHKYRAKRIVIDGHTFPSLAEGKRYGELKMLEKAGEISELELQPKFLLKAALTTGTMRGALQAATGEAPTIGVAIMDFAYRDKYGNRIVEDTKGMDTALSRWKRKHVQAQYGVTVRLITSHRKAARKGASA